MFCAAAKSVAHQVICLCMNQQKIEIFSGLQLTLLQLYFQVYDNFIAWPPQAIYPHLS